MRPVAYTEGGRDRPAARPDIYLTPDNTKGIFSR